MNYLGMKEFLIKLWYKGALFILCPLLLLSCAKERKYKVETNDGKTYIIKATGYSIYKNSISFYNDKGYVTNFKSVIEIE